MLAILDKLEGGRCRRCLQGVECGALEGCTASGHDHGVTIINNTEINNSIGSRTTAGMSVEPTINCCVNIKPMNVQILRKTK